MMNAVCTEIGRTGGKEKFGLENESVSFDPNQRVVVQYGSQTPKNSDR